ncbi:ABC transporter ATP-binding protein [uncultured Desulfobacter sp.]|uniref:ABC transporter ATP-binding protein n=1 Tax=uncultured Desulfobacter sp. TaxID=240139 RepID=UPI002AAC47A7|nr:ABC transporter ATP-binding protein [uncultured Desulfobacter sp.]
MSCLIEICDIKKSYAVEELSVPVLKGVSFSVEQGELVALTGASGSGKSTLMNIPGCLDRPDSGEYRLDGQSVSALSNDHRAVLRNQYIGFIFQNFNLLSRTSAVDNVAMPLAYAVPPVSEREAIGRARDMLARVGLEHRMAHEPSQLSGGQQQRVAIARALINRPSLLLADEPTGNLDYHTGKDVLSMFQELNRTEGITILMVTHDNSVARHARRIIHVHDGRIADPDTGIKDTKGGENKA